MHCFLSFPMRAAIPSLAIFGSLIVTATSTSEGACRTGELDFDVEGDGCPALSLMQRHARLTSAQQGRKAAAAAETHKVTATEAVPAVDAAAAPVVEKVAAPASKAWHYGAAVETLGPVAMPVSLLSFGSDIHSSSHHRNTAMMAFGKYMLYVLLPVAVIGLVCILFCLMSDRKGPGETREVYKTASGQRQSPNVGGTTMPRDDSRAGQGLLTQSSLASTSSSMTRATQPLPSMIFSPINPSVRLPAEQQRKMPVCLLFPTMAADVRMRQRSFDVFWGSLDAPWFKIDVKPGSADSDRLELSEVHSGDNELCATVNLTNSEASTLQEGSSLFVVTNKQLKANTRGLAYRSAKDNSKVRNAVASWGSTVPGTDTGDGWLKVGDWYLPMTVDGCDTIVPTDAKDVPQFSGLQIMRADGMPFATFKPMSGGQYGVVRNGATYCYISIGTSSFLLEAKLPNGKRVAAVAREQVRVASGEMMLELCVEPQMDPVIMLIGCIAVLRQLPPHQE